MVRLLSSFAAFAFIAGSALAQTPPAAPAAAPAASAPAAAALPAAGATVPLTKGGKPRVKELRAQCAADAKTQGLKGDDRRRAVSDCVVKQRPDLASREACRADARAKGLKKDERKAFVRDCVKGKG